MTVAELHGKISRTGTNCSDRMEDLLTSHVFGNLRYISDDKGLNQILGIAINKEGHYLKLLGIGEWKYYFWPSFKRSEPDVYLENNKYKVIIEVKLHSGKSGAYESEDRTGEEDGEYIYRDQLAREWMDLMEKDQSKTPVLIYLTKDYLLPVDAFKQSWNELSESKEKFDQSIYYLSWSQIHFHLHKILEKKTDYTKYERRVLEDILQILERRNLRRFLKISVPEIKITSFPGRIFSPPKLISQNYPEVKPLIKSELSWIHQRT